MQEPAQNLGIPSHHSRCERHILFRIRDRSDDENRITTAEYHRPHSHRRGDILKPEQLERVPAKKGDSSSL